MNPEPYTLLPEHPSALTAYTLTLKSITSMTG